MAAPQAPFEPLTPDVAGRLSDFAKACKAATRIVSMYPATHPAIQAALGKISEAAKQATDSGPFTITVLPDALMIGGRGFAKPEQSVVELAALLHQQLIGEMTLVERLENDGWHAFLTLLSKSPEDARAMGGVAKAWKATGNKSIALKEIDYAEVLRGRGGAGEGASWDRILATLKEDQFRGGGASGPASGGAGTQGGGGTGTGGGTGSGRGSSSGASSGPDLLADLGMVGGAASGMPGSAGEAEAPPEDAMGDSAMQSMMALAESPEKLAQVAQRLHDLGKASGDDSLQQRKSLLELMHGLANYAAERRPAELNTVLNNMAGAAAKMSPDMLLTLSTDPPPMPGGGSRMDLAGELQSRLTDEMVTRFLAENIVKDRGASSRLATAFHTLIPDPGKQQEILAAAAEQAKVMFGDDAQFETVWSSSTEMLMSYSDAKFVSEGYARELTAAQTQAVEVEKIGDDPPARIRAWLATLAEDEIVALDHRVTLDLLIIEKRPEAWAGVLDTAIADIDALVRDGNLMLASQLLDTVATVSRDEASPFMPAAKIGMTKLVDGSLVRHLATFLRQATDTEFGVARQMCKTIGPVLVKPMSDAIMGEDNPKTVRRLRDILISFGPAAREYANELRNSRNAAVRRAAVDLLRALGGDAALPDLRAMLDDSDQQVQREALRAIVQIGTSDAYKMLEKALRDGAAHTREAIMQALGAFRDEKAAPLFVHILNNTPHTGQSEGLYTQTLEGLGRVANDERSIEVLKTILYRGEWWAPGRTGRIRSAAARALRGMGNASADLVLEQAAAGGPGGVRRVARAALAEPAPMRRVGPRGTT